MNENNQQQTVAAPPPASAVDVGRHSPAPVIASRAQETDATAPPQRLRDQSHPCSIRPVPKPRRARKPHDKNAKTRQKMTSLPISDVSLNCYPGLVSGMEKQSQLKTGKGKVKFLMLNQALTKARPGPGKEYPGWGAKILAQLKIQFLVTSGHLLRISSQ